MEEGNTFWVGWSRLGPVSALTMAGLLNLSQPQPPTGPPAPFLTSLALGPTWLGDETEMFSGRAAGTGGDGVEGNNPRPGVTMRNDRPLSTELMSAQLQPPHGELTVPPSRGHAAHLWLLLVHALDKHGWELAPFSAALVKASSAEPSSRPVGPAAGPWGWGQHVPPDSGCTSTLR